MALFRRKKDSSVLPEEVNQYYESQRRERTGVAIALGLVALVVTLLIGTALFFGGRYVYNQITEDDEPTTGQTQNPPAEEGTVNVQDDSSQDDSTKTDDQADDSATSSDEDFSNVTLDGGEGDDAQQPATGDSESIPALGDEPEALPATGDPGQ